MYFFKFKRSGVPGLKPAGSGADEEVNMHIVKTQTALVVWTLTALIKDSNKFTLN